MAEREEPEFDSYAADYDADLQRGLKFTGANKWHYLINRVMLLRSKLYGIGITSPSRVLDFGCGDGDASADLRALLDAKEVVGVDVSRAMLNQARARHPSETYASMDELPTLGTFDVAYCNGVFHHIPLDERVNAAKRVFNALRPGGAFGLWENNPWNPGTRFVMSRVEFDRDAITLSPPETRALLRAAGFEIARTDHLFILPGQSSMLRSIERLFSRLPIGGQYQVLARRAS